MGMFKPLCFFMLLAVAIYAGPVVAGTDSLGVFRGRLADTQGKNVYAAAIVNLNTGEGCISDADGFFYIRGNPQNRLWIKHLAYETLEFTLPENLLNDTVFTIILTPRTYQLSEVVISNLPATWQEFERAVINMPFEEDPVMKIKALVYAGPMYNQGLTFKGPFQTLYDNFSKEAKQKRKLENLVKAEEYYERIEKRYGLNALKRITGIAGEKEIEEFRIFCGLSDIFILYAADFEFYSAISKCMKEFETVVR
jgi:hypothetical protein